MDLPEALARWATAHVGPIVGAERRGGAVWALARSDGGRVFLKAHRQPGKHRRERDAYRRWAPHLPAPTPRLLAAADAPRALLLSALRGRPFEGARLDPRARLDLHRQAGAALSGLHAQPFEDPDPLPLAAALERRTEAWAKDAPPRLAERLRGWRADLPLGGLSRVPCHRDFEPRNWVVLDGAPPRLALLDFEHARGDVWLADLTRLAGLVWPGAPDLEAAFWDGYGRRPTPDEQAVLRFLLALDAVRTHAWGRAHHDPALIRRGEEMMARLGLDAS